MADNAKIKWLIMLAMCFAVIALYMVERTVGAIAVATLLVIYIRQPEA